MIPYDAGWAAFDKDYSLEDNPHPKEGDEWLEWQQGWLDAWQAECHGE